MSTTTISAERTILRVDRDVTGANADELREAWLGAIRSGQVNLALDLSGAKIIDSSGLGLFLQCQSAARARGGSLTLICAQPSFRELFELTRIDQRIPVVAALS